MDLYRHPGLRALVEQHGDRMYDVETRYRCQKANAVLPYGTIQVAVQTTGEGEAGVFHFHYDDFESLCVDAGRLMHRMTLNED